MMVLHCWNEGLHQTPTIVARAWPAGTNYKQQAQWPVAHEHRTAVVNG